MQMWDQKIDAVQVADLEVPYIMMHMRGSPATMQQPKNTAYRDACTEVGAELGHRIQNAVAAGIQPWRIITDPGIQAKRQKPSLWRRWQNTSAHLRHC